MSKGLCSYCSEKVDTNASSRNYRLVTGWTRMRKQGGANAVHLPKDLEEYMHWHCMDLLKAGISPDQEQLF